MPDSLLETAGTVSDEALVLRAQTGERDALEQLFARHRPWIFNIAIRMLGRRADAAVLTYELLRRNGSATTYWNATQVYCRKKEGWRIIHTHWSTAKEQQQ